MSLEVLYTLSAKTPNVNDAVIIRDGVRIGTTPLVSSVRTTSLAALGGTTSYIAEKTGYISNVQYKLFLIRNPYFDLSQQNNPRRELEQVFFEYGERVRYFPNQFSKTFPDFESGNGNGGTGGGGELGGTESGLGGNDPAFPGGTGGGFDDFGNPINPNPGIIEDPEYGGDSDSSPYSNVPIYVIAVLKYVNNILDESFIQLASNSKEILLEFNLTPKIELPICDDPNALNFGQKGICIYDPETGPGGDGGGDEEEEEEEETITQSFPLRIRQSISNSVKLFTNPDDDTATSRVLSNERFETLGLDGTSFRISSSDLTKYRITRIRQTSGYSTVTVAEAPSDNESITYNFILDSPTYLNVEVEELEEPTLPDKPSIRLAGFPIFEYNVNSPQRFISVGIIKETKVDSIRAVIGDIVINFSDLGSADSTILEIPTSYFEGLGYYQINLIPFNEERGDGDIVDFQVNVVSVTFVGVPDIRNIKYPETIFGPDFVGYDVDFEISYESVNTDYIELRINDSDKKTELPATGKTTLNFKQLLELGNVEVSPTDKEASILLKLTPFNISGDTVIDGETELLSIKFVKGDLTIRKGQVINRLIDAFLTGLSFNEISDDSSKYLTHNLHVGEGDNKVISNWIGSEGTLIAKLYEPLPTSIQENQQVWISKLQSNPIIETISLSGDEQLVCTPIKGPNFSIEVNNGIGYQIYDNLIASGSATSDLLINRYFDGLNIDTTKLDIQYTSGSTYLFENFVNFGSAEERVNNFYYKVQLIENYVDKLNSLTDGLELGQILTELTPNDSIIDGYQSTSPILFTEDEVFTLDVEQRVWRNPTEKIEADKVINNLRTLLASFDGFENFLYTSDNPLSWPKVTIQRAVTGFPIKVLKNSQDSTLLSWFDNLVSLASVYDRNNINYLVNNTPLFIQEDTENSEFLLFLDMIGQHFDVIWVYINALKRLRKNDEAGIKGVPKEFVHSILKSFGWDGVRAYDSQFLWEYALGQTKEGQQKYSTSLEDANNQIWKRILNNLPYLLKHKGTARAMKAIMATYGVPQSMLTIMEFGGPIDPEESGTIDFTFDDRTAALNMISGSTVNIPWKSVSGNYPQSIEFILKPYNNHSTTIVSASNFHLDIVQTGSKAYLEFDLGGEITQSVPFSYSTENYSGILINKNTDNYEVLYKTSDGQRVYITSSLQLDSTASVDWNSGDVIKFGNSFTGALDEVRLWRVPLEESKFENHVLFPNAINGNSYTASTADLLVRLDFEYPIDFSTGTSTVPSESIKNVAINTSYDEPFATVSFFQNENTYPYNYIPYERTVTTKVPSLGYNYANKIRSEEQTLVNSLSHKKRATKGSFDRAPIDSSRLGLFFSPIKELNMDILKSLGDFNVDNYIGNPADEYKSEYKELEILRNYYFERLNRNTSEYIRLIKYISKSLFDVLESLAPARAKVSKGLLIEPHFLERSKTRWDKPSSLRNDFVGEVSASEDVSFITQKKDYQTILDVEDETTLVAEEKVYDGLLNIEEETTLVSDERFFNSVIDEGLTGSFDTQYLVHTASIFFEFTASFISEYDALENFTSVGTDPTSLAVLGFGLFAEDTTTIWKRFNQEDNTITQSRSDVYLLEQTFSRKVPVQVGGWPTIGSQPGDQIVVDIEEIPYIKRKINILPFDADAPKTDSLVTKVTPLQGYFPTHYRFVNGLSTGLERSFFEGSKQTIDTTPDGLSPVEVFETNPNILRVTDTGRGSGEPILEVD